MFTNLSKQFKHWYTVVQKSMNERKRHVFIEKCIRRRHYLAQVIAGVDIWCTQIPRIEIILMKSLKMFATSCFAGASSEIFSRRFARSVRQAIINSMFAVRKVPISILFISIYNI